MKAEELRMFRLVRRRYCMRFVTHAQGEDSNRHQLHHGICRVEMALGQRHHHEVDCQSFHRDTECHIASISIVAGKWRRVSRRSELDSKAA